MDKINWNLVILLAVIIIIALVLNSLFGEVKGEGKGSKAFNGNNYVGLMKENVRGAKSGKLHLTIPSEEVKRLVNGLNLYLEMVDVPEEKVIATLKSARTRGDITAMSYFYKQKTSKDLLSSLNSVMDKSEAKIIFRFVNKLPVTIKK